MVIATPPLLASRIEFDPALPPDYASLLRSYAPGAIIRGIATFDEPFWRDDGLTGETLAALAGRGREAARPPSPLTEGLEGAVLG
jgi:monoamine oxidase